MALLGLSPPLLLQSQVQLLLLLSFLLCQFLLLLRWVNRRGCESPPALNCSCCPPTALTHSPCAEAAAAVSHAPPLNGASSIAFSQAPQWEMNMMVSIL